MKIVQLDGDDEKIVFITAIPLFILKAKRFYWYLFKKEEIFTLFLMDYWHCSTEEVLGEIQLYLNSPSNGKYIGGDRDFTEDAQKILSFIAGHYEESYRFFNELFGDDYFRDHYDITLLSFNLRDEAVISVERKGKVSEKNRLVLQRH